MIHEKFFLCTDLVYEIRFYPFVAVDGPSSQASSFTVAAAAPPNPPNPPFEAPNPPLEPPNPPLELPFVGDVTPNEPLLRNQETIYVSPVQSDHMH